MEIKKATMLKVLIGVLAILLVVSIFTNGFRFGGITGGVSAVDPNKAADKAVKYINDNLLQEGMTAELEKIGEEHGIYSFKVDIGGKLYDSYITKDGKMLFTATAFYIDEEPTIEKPKPQEPKPPADVPKSDKPEVEVFVMSHCPFGTQIEKGIIPVVKLLGDKIDFNLRFVYYVMHGEKELDEQINQYCIEKEQNSKLIPYLECFLEDGDSERCVTEAKVSKTKLKSCFDATDEEFKMKENFADQSTWLNGRFPLFDIHKELNEEYGISGSPGLVVNGVKVQSSRDPASLLATICNGFEDAPSECDEELDSANPSAGFGYEPSASGGSAGTCG
ncbi:hypothetical protein KY342_06405 [Candidatus Woesearchaeota archaeon]|nr:hypothetical protein [Candidatus Woesearchaeota archaeon]